MKKKRMYIKAKCIGSKHPIGRRPHINYEFCTTCFKKKKKELDRKFYSIEKEYRKKRLPQWYKDIAKSINAICSNCSDFFSYQCNNIEKKIIFSCWYCDINIPIAIDNNVSIREVKKEMENVLKGF